MASNPITFEHLLRHPIRQTYDISGTPASAVGATLKQYMSSHTANYVPDDQAITFYAFCQMTGYLMSIYDTTEPLSTDDAAILESYTSFMDGAAVRAAVYLLIICIRESRHAKAEYKVDVKIAVETGEAAIKWVRSHTGGENYSSLWESSPNCTLGQLVTAVRRVFYEGTFGSSSFGGPAWGGIADCIESFIYGKSSAEIMMDTVWTLSHNNGPIFNKGMLYKHHTDHLKVILDVQRAGMIMQGIIEQHDCMAKHTNATIRGIVTSFASRYPDSIDNPYIDWSKLKKLGAIGYYPGYSVAQKKKYGASPFEEEPAVMATKAEAMEDKFIVHFQPVGGMASKKITADIVKKPRAVITGQVHDSVTVNIKMPAMTDWSNDMLLGLAATAGYETNIKTVIPVAPMMKPKVKLLLKKK